MNVQGIGQSANNSNANNLTVRPPTETFFQRMEITGNASNAEVFNTQKIAIAKADTFGSSMNLLA
jgi:hypothetical protein